MAIALAIAYAWVTTEFSLSMSLLAALMACCAEAMAADAPDGAGSPEALSEGNWIGLDGPASGLGPAFSG